MAESKAGAVKSRAHTGLPSSNTGIFFVGNTNPEMCCSGRGAPCSPWICCLSASHVVARRISPSLMSGSCTIMFGDCIFEPAKPPTERPESSCSRSY